MIPKDQDPQSPYKLSPGGLTEKALDAVINDDPKKALEAITELENGSEEDPGDQEVEDESNEPSLD